MLKFDSKAEARRWAELLLRERAGLISRLERQVRFPLDAFRVCGPPQTVGHYVADFVYVEDGKQIIEDAKGGAITDLASWKLRHVHAQYGAEVKLVGG
jgi:hypothetical protein